MIVPAFRGRTNEERLLVFQDGEPINLAPLGITSAKAVVQGQEIDASVQLVQVMHNDALVEASELVYQPGQFELRPSHYQMQMVVFRTDDQEGEVIAGPGLPTSIELQYHG